MSATIDTKKTKEIVNSLKSNDIKIVKRAIKQSKVHGNEAIFAEILDLLINHESEEVKTDVKNFLLDLKDSKALPMIIEAIKSEDFKNVKAELISIFWNCPLNPNDYISLFVKEAIKGDFMIALESSTVINNIEPPFPEAEVNESLLLLKEYFSNHPEDDKTELLKDILVVIKEMEQSVNLN